MSCSRVFLTTPLRTPLVAESESEKVTPATSERDMFYVNTLSVVNSAQKMHGGRWSCGCNNWAKQSDRNVKFFSRSQVLIQKLQSDLVLTANITKVVSSNAFISLTLLVWIPASWWVNNIDVVETVTSETETWLKFWDKTETETLS